MNRNMLHALREASRALAELDPLAEKHNAVLIDEALREVPTATWNEVLKAREVYQTDDIEIDSTANVSDAMPEGKWIAAWVWLSAETIEDANKEYGLSGTPGKES